MLIGGTSFGGPGDYWRTALGTLILSELTPVVIGNGTSAADQQILSGGPSFSSSRSTGAIGECETVSDGRN